MAKSNEYYKNLFKEGEVYSTNFLCECSWLLPLTLLFFGKGQSLICSCSRGRAFNWDCGNASKSYGSSMLPSECLRFPEITKRWITRRLIPPINMDERNWHISRSRVLHIPSDLIREREPYEEKKVAHSQCNTQSCEIPGVIVSL